jgi:uncharacterized protein (TIGR00251 family)
VSSSGCSEPGRPTGPLTPTAEGTRLTLRVQPRAARDEVAGRHGEAIRVRLAAPPVDGAANEALIRFLADRLALPRAALRLVRGQVGRDKIVDVAGLPPEQVARRLGL